MTPPLTLAPDVGDLAALGAASLEDLLGTGSGLVEESRAQELSSDGSRVLLRCPLPGTPRDVVAGKTYLPFFMHRTSHWLGLDVHDVGGRMKHGRPRRLGSGMVLTVEPGLYIRADAAGVPAAYRGLGIRIEDDLLVTATGHEVLTGDLPRTAAAIERACRRAPHL